MKKVIGYILISIPVISGLASVYAKDGIVGVIAVMLLVGCVIGGVMLT